MARFLPAGNLAARIYGTIIVSAVLVAISEGGNTPLEMIAEIVVTTLVFEQAHAWAFALAASAKKNRPVTFAEFRRAVRDEWPTVSAAAPAVMWLGLGALGVLSAQNAAYAAVYFNILLLFVWGAALRHQAGGSVPRTIGTGTATAFFGCILVLLKVLVH